MPHFLAWRAGSRGGRERMVSWIVWSGGVRFQSKRNHSTPPQKIWDRAGRGRVTSGHPSCDSIILFSQGWQDHKTEGRGLEKDSPDPSESRTALIFSHRGHQYSPWFRWFQFQEKGREKGEKRTWAIWTAMSSIFPRELIENKVSSDGY